MVVHDIRRIAPLLGLFCASVAAAAAPAESRSGPEVTVELSRPVAYENEVVLLRIRISGFSQAEQPVVPPIDGALVGALGGPSESSFTSIVGGRVSRSVSRTYTLEITPTRTGVLRIPPISVRVDGETIQSDPRTIRVIRSDAAELVSAELSFPRARVYVGQRVRVTLTIRVKAAEYGDRTLDVQETFNRIDMRSLGAFADARFSIAADSGADGRHAFEASTYVVPRNPGKLAIEDLVVAVNYPTEFAQDWFGNWSVADTRRLRAIPTSNVEVLPLPAQGRPEGFSGAVGRFDIRASTSAVNVRVGDPIPLAVEISGDGPIESLGPPLLAADQRLAADFIVPRETLAGEIVAGRKRFTQTIRAKRADISGIPPIEYPFFDPYDERYRVARTGAIPLSVRAADRLDPSDLGNLAVPDAGGQPAEPMLDGLRGNETDESRLLERYGVVRPWHAAAALLVPPAAYLLIWGPTCYRRARQRDVVGRRRQAALPQAKRRIAAAAAAPRDSGDDSAIAAASEIRAAMCGYLADRFDEPAGRFDSDEAARRLQTAGADEALVREWRELLNACEQASFGMRINGDEAALAGRARDCLTRTERVRL
jgi:hypothetical protein